MQTEEHFGVCSRNNDLKLDDTKSRFVDMFLTHNLREFTKTLSDRFGCKVAIQGELCGPAIQCNRIGLSSYEFFLFNVFDISHDRFIDPFSIEDLQALMKPYNIDTVPLLYRSTMDNPMPFKTVEELLEFSKAQKYPNGHPAEGVVWRTCDQLVSFKVMNHDFLLKTGE